MRALSSNELWTALTRLEAAGPEDASNSRKPSSATPRLLAHDPRIVAGDLKTLKDALAYISADAPRGNGSIIGPDDWPVDDYWLGVILAVHREFGTAGEPVAREWSEGSARYGVEGFDNAWNAHDPAHDNPVTIKSVYKLAQSFGWSGSAPTSSPRPASCPIRYRFLDRTAIMAIAPIQWRVKGLFPTTGIGVIFGPSSSGKSFLAVDLGIHIALGQKWFGRRLLACPVTYVMLEGEGGLRNRIVAWETQNGIPIPSDFHVITQPFMFTDLQDVEDLAASLPKDGVVIIDTLNRAAPGSDENSSKDMGLIVAGMKRLQEVTGGLVLVAHHTGKDVARGMRGHSSLYAALDGAIEVKKTDNVRSWSAAKVKDGLDGMVVPFKLHIHQLGKDADGEVIESCSIGPDVGAVLAPKEPTGRCQQAALTVIRRSLSCSELTGMAGCGPSTQCMKVEEAIEDVKSTLAAVAANKRRNRARTIVSSLITGGFVATGFDNNEEGWLWRG